MKALALLHSDEVSLLDLVYDALQEINVDLSIIVFNAPFNTECAQREEIFDSIKVSDVVVYFASKKNMHNNCLDLALREAARINKKVICIGLEDGGVSVGFEQLGDCLIASVYGLPEAISNVSQDWQNADGTLREDRPFKRYKCGAKE